MLRTIVIWYMSISLAPIVILAFDLITSYIQEEKMKTMSSELHRAAEQAVRNEQRLAAYQDRYLNHIYKKFFEETFRPEDIMALYNQRLEK